MYISTGRDISGQVSASNAATHESTQVTANYFQLNIHPDVPL